MAFRERSNSAGRIFNWIKDSFIKDREEKPKPKQITVIPKRATSTPHRRSSANLNESLDLSGIFTQQLNFAELNAFGVEKHFGHPDFDNDIATYSFYTQIVPCKTENEWKSMGGDNMYRKVALAIYDVYLERPMPREVFHLAIYYLQSYMKHKKVIRYDIDDFAVAVVDMAAKVERQCGCRLNLLDPHSVKGIFEIQKQILKMRDFSLWPTTMPFFMRLLNHSIVKKDWHWECARAYSDLMLCERELAEICPSLGAGVVMHIVSQLKDAYEWNENCYAIIQQPREAYQRPLAILCRLILNVLDCPRKYEPVYSKNERVFRCSQQQRGIFQDEVDYAEFHNII